MAYLTKVLIPKDQIAVTETFGPRGYLAGRYDADGLISEQRWFVTLSPAETYAATLDGQSPKAREEWPSVMDGAEFPFARNH